MKQDDLVRRIFFGIVGILVLAILLIVNIQAYRNAYEALVVVTTVVVFCILVYVVGYAIDVLPDRIREWT